MKIVDQDARLCPDCGIDIRDRHRKALTCLPCSLERRRKRNLSTNRKNDKDRKDGTTPLPKKKEGIPERPDKPKGDVPKMRPCISCGSRVYEFRVREPAVSSL